ncbi:hypothetical protein [Alteromonas sp.]|uniref:hypothetical protein n=1 Tax=Alteromonas sp. TaxID=232 RepID=UPI003514DA22
MSDYADCFIWIGCGYQNNLRFLKGLCDKTVLVDGDSRVHQNWRVTSSGVNEQFVERVISARGGKTRFNIYSNSYFNSIASASLKVPADAQLISKQTAESVGIVELISSFQGSTEKNSNFILAIDVEDPLFRMSDELGNNKLLKSVTVLVLRLAKKTLKIKVFEEKGFVLKGKLKSGNDNYIFLVSSDCSFELSKEIENVFSSFKRATIDFDKLSTSVTPLLLGREVGSPSMEACPSDDLRAHKGFLASHNTLTAILQSDSIVLDYNNWSLAPDALLCIVRLIKKLQIDTVIEFGAGVSTRVLSSLQKRGFLSLKTYISYEHSRHFFEETRKLINALNLEQHCNIQFSPLENVSVNDEELVFYKCENSLKEIKNCDNALVIVDGPPSNGGKMARYPALPIVMDSLGCKKLIIFLDDFNREQEKEIVKEWEKYCNIKGLDFFLEEVPLLKGGAILSLRKF